MLPAIGGFGQPQTNSYFLVFSSPNAGSHQSSSSGRAFYIVGSFVRDQSLVGQQIAPTQLSAGEVYSLLTIYAGVSNLTTLVINSSTSGMLISEGSATLPGAGITPVRIEYLRLGSLSCQLQVVLPAIGGFGQPETNSYLLVFSSTNAGRYQSISVRTATPIVGSFVRDRSLVGQQIAPAQLSAGEVYSLLTDNFGSSNLTTLVINSPRSGMLVSPGNPAAPGAGITPVTINYLRLGPLSGQLQVVLPASGGFVQPQTNSYLLVFSSLNAGWHQSSSEPAMSSVGSFVCDRSLVGQQIASAQLSAGEIYSLLTPNAGFSNLTTLVINSPTSGILISLDNAARPVAGIIPVSIEYLRLGALSCQLQVVLPANSAFFQPQTNSYLLVFSSPNGGWHQNSSGGAAAPSVGSFVRDRSLVGQQVAPAQLTAGESYRMTSSMGPSVMIEALLVNSLIDGILVSESTGPESGIFRNVALRYLTLGALSAQIQAVIPPTLPMFTSRTNTYLLVYTAGDSGQFQRTSDPATSGLGQFRRSAAQ